MCDKSSWNIITYLRTGVQYKYNLPTLSLEKTQEEDVCWLQINLCLGLCSKLALTFRLIHSTVTLGHPDDHFRDGFQMKQAVSWPIPLAQNTAA